MLTRGSLDRAQSSVRAMMFLITLIIGGAIFGYGAGYGAIRYPDIVNDPFFTWVYWRYWVMLATLVATLVGMLFYAFDVSVSVGRVRGLIFWAVMAAVGYTAVFLVWEIVIWTRCADNATPSTCDHWRNRDYPATTSPDPAFFLTLFGAGLGGIGMLISLYMINQMTCASLATRNVNAQNLGVSNTAATFDDADYFQAEIGHGIMEDPRYVGLAFHSKDE
jgi:hypothetical protein